MHVICSPEQDLPCPLPSPDHLHVVCQTQHQYAVFTAPPPPPVEYRHDDLPQPAPPPRDVHTLQPARYMCSCRFVRALALSPRSGQESPDYTILVFQLLVPAVPLALCPCTCNPFLCRKLSLRPLGSFACASFALLLSRGNQSLR